MLILPKSCFLHVPKTGGSWVKKGIRSAVPTCEEYSIDGNPHIGLAHCPPGCSFRFAFVRHPVDFYRSYWQFKMTSGWDPRNQLDTLCASDNFSEFVCRVLDRYPGIYSTKLLTFIGLPDEEIEFVGRYENLVEDLITALNAAGEQFIEAVIRQTPPYNVSDKQRFPAEYTRSLEQRVKDSEEMIMARFNYS